MNEVLRVDSDQFSYECLVITPISLVCGPHGHSKHDQVCQVYNSLSFMCALQHTYYDMDSTNIVEIHMQVNDTI